MFLDGQGARVLSTLALSKKYTTVLLAKQTYGTTIPAILALCSKIMVKMV